MITVTDQFCGAGGSSIGAVAAGAELRQKTCQVCGKSKAVSEFYVRPNSLDGFRNDCKECTKKRAKASAQRNADHRSEYMKRYGEENREHLNEQARRRAKLNGRKHYFRRYRSQNKTSVLANEQRYRQRNRHKEAARRHMRRGMPLDNTARQYIAILQNDSCSYCGSTGGTIDHITPVVSGGTNDWDNLTAACKSCNSRKHDRTLLTFLLEAHDA